MIDALISLPIIVIQDIKYVPISEFQNHIEISSVGQIFSSYENQPANLFNPVAHLPPESTVQLSITVTQVPEISTPAETKVPTTQQYLRTQPSSEEEKPFIPKRIPLPPLVRNKPRSSSSPGVTIQIPSAYGKSWGSASVGFGFQSRARFRSKSDAVTGIGIGLGDARKAVGLDVNFGIYDLSDFQNGGLSLKLHRILPNDFAVAVGIKNAIRVGNTDAGTSTYGVVTKMIRLQNNVEKPFSRLFLSFGVGDGQFRSESDIRNKIDSIGVFGGLAVRVAEPVSAIAEWTGQDLNLGLSIAPFRNIPLVITPAFTDITNNAGDGSRFILGIGYGISF